MTTVLYMTIEGVAQRHSSTNTAVLKRFSRAPFSGDSEGAYVECMTSSPNEVASSINPRDGEFTTGGMSFELVATPEVIAALFDGRQIATGTLTANMTSTQTTINTDVSDGSLANTLCVLEREVLAIGAHSGSGVYTVARGQANTQATSHSASNTEGAPTLLDASTFPVQYQRLVTLGLALDDGAQSDYSAEQTQWVGLLDGISATADTVTVNAVPVWALLDDASVCNDLWEGAPTGAGGLFQGRGKPQAASGSVAVVVDKITLLVGCTYTYDEDEDITTLRLSTTPASDLASPTREDLQKAKLVREVHVCTTTTTGTYPPPRNVVDLCLYLLLTSPQGDNLGSGGEDYDGGVEDLGLAIPSGLIDIASFEDVRDSLGDLAVAQNHYLGADGKPIKVKSYVSELLRPLGCVLATNTAGQITCVRLRDNDPTAQSITLLTDPDTGGSYPTVTPRPDLTYNALRVEWDARPPLDPRNDTFRHAIRIRQTLSSKREEMQMGHYADEALVRTLAVYHVTRYSRPIQQIDVSVLRTTDVALGDLVTITASQIPLAGGRGVTDLLCLVVARRLILDTGAIRLRLWAVGAVYDRTGLIAPAARVASYKVGAFGPTFTVDDNAFTGGTASGYATDAAGFVAGDVVDHCNRDHSVRETGLVVTSTTSNTISVSVAPSNTPVAGDLLKFSPYSSQTNTAPWAWLYDTALAWTAYNWTT